MVDEVNLWVVGRAQTTFSLCQSVGYTNPSLKGVGVWKFNVNGALEGCYVTQVQDGDNNIEAAVLHNRKFYFSAYVNEIQKSTFLSFDLDTLTFQTLCNFDGITTIGRFMEYH